MELSVKKQDSSRQGVADLDLEITPDGPPYRLVMCPRLSASFLSLTLQGDPAVKISG